MTDVPESISVEFPERPCIVEFHVPEDPEKLTEYPLSFWQKCHQLISE
jgi:hypothetical protein